MEPCISKRLFYGPFAFSIWVIIALSSNTGHTRMTLRLRNSKRDNSALQPARYGTSTFRTDQLAYGGVKNSGIGREGPLYAIRDMTEERMIVFNV